MLTSLVRLNDKLQKVAYPQLTLLFFFSKHLKVFNLLFYDWGLSSAGEHYAEDVGVPGSTPGDPIARTPYRFPSLNLSFKFWSCLIANI